MSLSRDAARSSVVLGGLWALAVAQPILDVLGRAPEFSVAHRADMIDAAVVAGALSFASRDLAALRQADLFGIDKWPAFAVPGFRGLVGRDVASFGDIRPIDGVRVAFDERQMLKDVDPKGPEVPAQLLGRFVQPDRAAAARHVLAIALNGKVVATTRAWPGSLRWRAMLPPDALRAGPNDLDVFVVDSSQPNGLLRPRQ